MKSLVWHITSYGRRSSFAVSTNVRHVLCIYLCWDLYERAIVRLE